MSLIITKRQFFKGALATGIVAPNLVQASSLMQIKGETLPTLTYMIHRSPINGFSVENWVYDHFEKRVIKIMTAPVDSELVRYWNNHPKAKHWQSNGCGNLVGDRCNLHAAPTGGRWI
jgi:hypothetical protein